MSKYHFLAICTNQFVLHKVNSLKWVGLCCLGQYFTLTPPILHSEAGYYHLVNCYYTVKYTCKLMFAFAVLKCMFSCVFVCNPSCGNPLEAAVWTNGNWQNKYRCVHIGKDCSCRNTLNTHWTNKQFFLSSNTCCFTLHTLLCVIITLKCVRIITFLILLMTRAALLL